MVDKSPIDVRTFEFGICKAEKIILNFASSGMRKNRSRVSIISISISINHFWPTLEGLENFEVFIFMHSCHTRRLWRRKRSSGRRKKLLFYFFPFVTARRTIPIFLHKTDNLKTWFSSLLGWLHLFATF